MTKIRIPPTLRTETGGEREVEASGATVRELLDDLSTRFPGLHAQIFGLLVHARQLPLEPGRLPPIVAPLDPQHGGKHDQGEAGGDEKPRPTRLPVALPMVGRLIVRGVSPAHVVRA